jgi:uncharacterized protein YcgI (DUF1989 family)
MGMSVQKELTLVPKQTAVAFRVCRGNALTIIDPQGSQVADLAAYCAADVREQFSAGRTIDYAGRINFPVGSVLYSNRSNPMFVVERDDVGVHDCLLSPCSERMFELLRGETAHPSCHGNLSMALNPYGIGEDAVLATLNVFMNVTVLPSGETSIQPPISKAGDRLVMRACMDLIVGLSACSSEFTNGGRCAEIAYVVE